MAPASFFLLCECYLSGTHWNEWITSPLCAQVLFRLLFPCYMSAGCLPCLFSKNSPNALWALPEPSLVTFRIASLSPAGCKISWNLACFVFQAILIHVLPSVLVGLSPFFVTEPPAYHNGQDLFLSQATSPHFLPSLMWPILYL